MSYGSGIFSVLRDSIDSLLFVKGLAGTIMCLPLLIASVRISVTGTAVPAKHAAFRKKAPGCVSASWWLLGGRCSWTWLFSGRAEIAWHRYALVSCSDFPVLCVCTCFIHSMIFCGCNKATVLALTVCDCIWPQILMDRWWTVLALRPGSNHTHTHTNTHTHTHTHTHTQSPTQGTMDQPVVPSFIFPIFILAHTHKHDTNSTRVSPDDIS